MAYKILGQSRPNATTNTTMYTVPGSYSTVVSTITICNTSATPSTYRLFTVQSGGSGTTSNCLIYDATIGANDLVSLTLGITLAAAEFIVVYATNATLTFQAFGNESPV